VGALDAFYSTWSDARATFGQGTPQDGTKLDNSSRLMQMKAGVEAAAPDGRWQGPASEAYAAKNKEHAGVYGKLAELDTKMAAEVSNAANVVTAGRQSLDNTKSWVDSAAAAIPPGVSASDRDSKLLSIANQGISRVSDIVTESTHKMTEISGRVQTLKGDYAALANGKPAPGEQKLGDDKDDKKDGEDDKKDDVHQNAEQDVHNTLAGDQQAAAKVDDVLSGIKPGQKLTEEQSAYLSQMQAQQKGMSVEELKTAAARLGDHKGVIANSWQLMSTKDVQFAVTEPKVGALDDPKYTTRGGSDLLPDSVQDVLQRADQTIVTDDHPMTKALAFGSQLESIADIVKDGNPAFQTGTELDRQMIVAADKAMDVIADNPRTGGAEAIQSLFEAVDDDHRIINDQVMGRSGVSADDFLHDVNAIDWPDNGKAAGHLFSWTNENSTGPDSQLAGETAEKYASYIGDPKNGLMKMDGQTLGQLNPELVREYAHGLMPYVPDIAGLSNASDGNGFDRLDQNRELPIAKGIFSVLATDKDAYASIQGAAQANMLTLSHEWAQDVQDGKFHKNDARMADCATLQALSAVGSEEAAKALHLNAKELYEQKKDAYEIASKMLSGGSGLVPGVGPALAPSLDIFGTAMEKTILGEPPSDDNAPATIPPMFADDPARFALNALLADGVPPENLAGPGTVIAQGPSGQPLEIAVDGIDSSWVVDTPLNTNGPNSPVVAQIKGSDDIIRTGNFDHSEIAQRLSGVLSRFVPEGYSPEGAMEMQYAGITGNPVVK
jgi:hypothetical protein